LQVIFALGTRLIESSWIFTLEDGFPFLPTNSLRRRVFRCAELAKTLKASGCEIVLDPNFAEMAAINRFGSSSIQKLPWANLGRPWRPEDFDRTRNQDAAKAIAEFAVKAGVHAVLAPTHLLEQLNGAWRPIDLRMCEALRHELDKCGGSDIAVDYQLITTSALLKEDSNRAAFLADITQMPIENVWLRASGFGATATGAGTRQFVEAIRDFHATGRALVADMAGGFAALGAAAFGAVGGISHGVGQKESFKASAWKKPPGGGGGASSRAYVHELDIAISRKNNCRRYSMLKAEDHVLDATTPNAALMEAKT
jgi:hypothetical protein